MRVELGSRVRTRDGENIGTIDKLILDPVSGEVKCAVVRKGRILSNDVEVPIEAITTGAGDAVEIAYTRDETDRLPRFVESSYTSSPSDYTSPYGYPIGGVLWPTGYVGPLPSAVWGLDDDRSVDRDETALMRERDLTNAVVGEGSDVRSYDDEKVGEVHRIEFDTATGRPTRLVMRKGFLFTHDVELPADVIQSVDDGTVLLKLVKEEVERRFGGHRHSSPSGSGDA
ncbi:MAG: PRC-barrel domain-containing protein [Chloroflexi bacterium]|nr:PRC-barrel domain-containing protein [Chloroflexota bacterium]